MPGARIPSTDHLARLCGGTKCDENGRPLGAAFMMRTVDDSLSVNWLEVTGASSREDQLEAIRGHLLNKDMKLRATARLAVLQIASAFQFVQMHAEGFELSAYHEQELPHDPSHAGIYGYTAQDQVVADLLAMSVNKHYSAQGPDSD